MWHHDYPDRLEAWVQLRKNCQSLELPACLGAINQWWHTSPWRSYYLHWDDRWDWPDPWQLLADNVFCDVARALGMLYTIRLLDREDCADVAMVETDRGNLVQIDQGKYVLNWDDDTVVNISSQRFTIKRTLENSVLDHLTR